MVYSGKWQSKYEVIEILTEVNRMFAAEIKITLASKDDVVKQQPIFLSALQMKLYLHPGKWISSL